MKNKNRRIVRAGSGRFNSIVPFKRKAVRKPKKRSSKMLVLSRKANESIRIGEDIQVRVLEIKGSRVRIGIDAPGDVEILRREIERKKGGEDDTTQEQK